MKTGAVASKTAGGVGRLQTLRAQICARFWPISGLFSILFRFFTAKRLVYSRLAGESVARANAAVPHACLIRTTASFMASFMSRPAPSR